MNQLLQAGLCKGILTFCTIQNSTNDGALCRTGMRGFAGNLTVKAVWLLGRLLLLLFLFPRAFDRGLLSVGGTTDDASDLGFGGAQ